MTTNAGGVTTAVADVGQVPWWLVLLQGIAAALTGLFLVIEPAMTTRVIVVFLGWYWLIGGIFAIVTVFMDSTEWWWRVISGIIGILAGLYIIRHPLWAPLAVTSAAVIVLGVMGCVDGVMKLIAAFRGAGWGTGLLGVLSILFGLILLFNIQIGALTLPVVLGIFGIVFGIAAIVMAFRLKP